MVPVGRLLRKFPKGDKSDSPGLRSYPGLPHQKRPTPTGLYQFPRSHRPGRDQNSPLGIKSINTRSFRHPWTGDNRNQPCQG